MKFHFLLFSHSVVFDFLTPWTSARQASLSFTISRSLLKPMSIELVMPSNHLILCGPLLLLSSTFPNIIRVFSNESALRIRWPKYWSFSISPSNEYSGLISFRIDCSYNVRNSAWFFSSAQLTSAALPLVQIKNSGPLDGFLVQACDMRVVENSLCRVG